MPVNVHGFMHITGIGAGARVSNGDRGIMSANVDADAAVSARWTGLRTAVLGWISVHNLM